MSGFLSEVCILFSYSSARTVLSNDYNFTVCYFHLIGRSYSSFLFKKFREVLRHFTVANETEELTNSPSTPTWDFFIGTALSINTGRD